MKQLTIRGSRPGDGASLAALCDFLGERTANKAIWSVIRAYPRVKRQADELRRELEDAERRLTRLRAAVRAAEEARLAALELASADE